MKLTMAAVVGCAILLGGCATRPKTYTAPSDAKVKAATIDLNVKVARARETAKKAREAVAAAKASADRLPDLAKTTAAKLALLREKVPAEFHPLVDDVINAATAQSSEEETTRGQVNNANGWNTQLFGQLGEAEKARQTLQSAQDDYAGAAGVLAQDATTERNYRIAAEKQLSSQRWFGWLFKLGAFLLIAIVGLFFLLKWLGKLGWAAGKIGIKAAI